MEQHLAKRFVDHRRVSLAAKRVSKLALHHAERGFDVGALVVVLQELVLAEHEVMEHLLERSARLARRRTLERDERSAARLSDGIRVGQTAVSLVCRNLGDGEVFGGRFDHRSKRQRVVRVHLLNVDSGHDVGFDSAHEMTLHPILLDVLFAVLHIMPAGKPRSGESGRIDGKVSLNTAERQTALLDKAAQNGSHGRVFKVIKNRVVMRSGSDEALALRVPQIAHKATTAHRRIDLKHYAENGIRQGQLRASGPAIFGVCDSTAEIEKQTQKLILFVRLRGVVSGPRLRIGRSFLCKSYGFRHRSASICVVLPPHYIDRGVDVFAVLAAGLVVGARALWISFCQMPDRIDALPALRRHNPAIAELLNPLCGRQYDSALLSQVFHNHLAYLRDILLIRYILVKEIIVKIYLDSVLLPGILSGTWGWLTLRKRVINVLAAPIRGYRVRALSGSRESAQNARVRTGTSPARSPQRRDDCSLKSLAEREGFEPPTQCTLSAAVLQTAPLPGSGISPLSGPSEESAPQTFTPHSASDYLTSLLLICWLHPLVRGCHQFAQRCYAALLHLLHFPLRPLHWINPDVGDPRAFKQSDSLDLSLLL